MADECRIDLLGGQFKRGQLAGLEQQMVMDVFSKHVANVAGVVNDGKEATVYLCRSRPDSGLHDAFVAAKVYRSRRFRAFRNNADYADVGEVRDRRLAKAIRKPAPPLAQVRLAPEAARRAFAAVMQDVEILLDCGLVHGDLSACNVLYQDGRPRLIDLPQAVDVDGPADPWTLFHRDVDNVCGYFRRHGVDADALGLVMKLWARHVG